MPEVVLDVLPPSSGFSVIGPDHIYHRQDEGDIIIDIIITIVRTKIITEMMMDVSNVSGMPAVVPSLSGFFVVFLK